MRLKSRLPLQEEVSFFWEQQVEACQVDLLLIFLDLGEVGIVGEICDESAGYAVFGIEESDRENTAGKVISSQRSWITYN